MTLKGLYRHINDPPPRTLSDHVIPQDKKTIKLVTQSAQKSSCMGNWVVLVLANFIHDEVCRGPFCTGIFLNERLLANS